MRKYLTKIEKYLSYQYVMLDVIYAIYGKSNDTSSNLKDFLIDQKIINKDESPTEKSKDYSKGFEEFIWHKRQKTKNKIFLYDKKILGNYIKNNSDFKMFFYPAKELNLDLNEYFFIGEKIFDINGGDRDGWGEGVIVNIMQDFLSVKFANKKLPILVNRELFCYDRAGIAGSHRCLLLQDNDFAVKYNKEEIEKYRR